MITEMKERTILLVEDDYLNRRLSKKILAGNGYRIMESKNTAEALAILKNETIDLAVLDINLGEEQQDGISLGRKIKDMYTIPFIYLTAYDSTEIVSKAISTAPDSYLTKPFKDVDLIASVEIAISRSANTEKNEPSVLVKDGEYNLELPVNEIDHIECEGNYLMIYADHKVYKYRATIRQILETLPASSFVQTHRAFVVNKNKIEKFSSNSLIINGNTIPVSKKYADISMLLNGEKNSFYR